MPSKPSLGDKDLLYSLLHMILLRTALRGFLLEINEVCCDSKVDQSHHHLSLAWLYSVHHVEHLFLECSLSTEHTWGRDHGSCRA